MATKRHSKPSPAVSIPVAEAPADAQAPAPTKPYGERLSFAEFVAGVYIDDSRKNATALDTIRRACAELSQDERKSWLSHQPKEFSMLRSSLVSAGMSEKTSGTRESEVRKVFQASFVGFRIPDDGSYHDCITAARDYLKARKAKEMQDKADKHDAHLLAEGILLGNGDKSPEAIAKAEDYAKKKSHEERIVEVAELCIKWFARQPITVEERDEVILTLAEVVCKRREATKGLRLIEVDNAIDVGLEAVAV